MCPVWEKYATSIFGFFPPASAPSREAWAASAAFTITGAMANPNAPKPKPCKKLRLERFFMYSPYYYQLRPNNRGIKVDISLQIMISARASNAAKMRGMADLLICSMVRPLILAPT